MYIAVCDDDPQVLRQLSALMDSFAASAPTLRFQCFSDPSAMLRAARDEGFTHYFLDVMMPGMDGVAAARQIRSFDETAKIIFLTSFQEYAYQSYRVRAYDYLLKPVSAEALSEVLARLQREEDAYGECLCLQTGRSVMRIPFARLAFVEVNQKHVYFHTTDGQTRSLSAPMSQFEAEILARPEFIKIHRSYIVNLHCISEFSPQGCILLSGRNLPISRLLYNHVRGRYMAHLFGSAEVEG